jgi:hypothetical protein
MQSYNNLLNHVYQFLVLHGIAPLNYFVIDVVKARRDIVGFVVVALRRVRVSRNRRAISLRSETCFSVKL